jgi:hypothetical protein
VINISDAGQNYGNSQDTDEGGSGGMNFGAGKTKTSVCQYSFNLVVVNSIQWPCGNKSQIPYNTALPSVEFKKRIILIFTHLHGVV